MTNKKLYTVERAEKKSPFPEGITKAAEEILKKAVIEDNSQIPNRAKSLPEYTLILHKKINGNCSNETIDRPVNNINRVLGTKITKSCDNKLHVEGTLEEDRKFNPTYAISKEDAQKLFEHGIPKVIYSEEARRPAIRQDRGGYHKNSNIPGGKPLGGVREAALAEALSGNSRSLT